jgi:poly(rC)-binding protein 3/4
VQEAIFRVQNRISRAILDSKEHSMLARVIVSSKHIGCLLGKGGSIIAEMRNLSGAHIRMLGKDKGPKCVSEDDEVIQVQFLPYLILCIFKIYNFIPCGYNFHSNADIL